MVDKLDRASGQKLATRGEWFPGYEDRNGRYIKGKMFKYKVDPAFDFGAGNIVAPPKKAEEAFHLLDRLIYECEAQEHSIDSLKEEFIQAVTPFWKLEAEKQQVMDENNKPVTEYVEGEGRRPKLREPTAEEIATARTRKTRFVKLLDTVLAILIHKPIAEDATLSNADIAGLLEHQEKREAFVKTGSTAYAITTRDTSLLQEPVSAAEAQARLKQVQEQTRERFCIPRTELDAQDREEEPEAEPEQPEIPATPEQIGEIEPEYQPPLPPQPKREREERTHKRRPPKQRKPPPHLKPEQRQLEQPEPPQPKQPDEDESEEWQPYTEL